MQIIEFIKTCLKGCSQASERLYSSLAICLLVFYVLVEIIFRYSTAVVFYPDYLDVRDKFESAALALAFVVIVIKPHKLSVVQGLLVFIAASAFLISANRTDDYLLVRSFIVLVAVSGVDFCRLSKAYGMTVLALIAAIVVLSLLNCISNKDVIPNSRLVFSYGFGHPNILGALLFSGLAALSYSLWDRKSWIALAIVSAASALFSYVALSSFASAVLLMAVVLALIVGHLFPCVEKLVRVKWVYCGLLIAPVILFTIMAICTLSYDAGNELFRWFNNLVHARPYYAHEYYIGSGGISVFGEESRVVESYQNGVPFQRIDSGYSYLILVYGIFSLFAIFVTYCVAVCKLYSSSRPLFFLWFILIFSSVYLLVESHSLYLPTSFAALMLSFAFAPVAPGLGFIAENNLEYRSRKCCK